VGINRHRDNGTPRLNPSSNEPFAEIFMRRVSRRALLQGAAAITSSTILAPFTLRALAASQGLSFEELPKGIDETHHVAKGFTARPLIRWGDAVLADSPKFDPANQTAAAQEHQFGYNCDFTAYLPLPKGTSSSDHGLLVVNHEYTIRGLMFPGLARREPPGHISREQAEVELAAHGLSVVEIQRDLSGDWKTILGTMNRRISTRSTVTSVSGPAAGNPRLKTRADSSGKKVIGTLANCSGGVTPWGTVLTAEENFNEYFSGDTASTPEAENYQRIGFKEQTYDGWGKYFPRFDIAQEPNEPNRFGWMVEIDPYDPHSVPVKRTALGRFKHESANPIVNKDGRVVVYTGDDQAFEYLYRYVSSGRFSPGNPSANKSLLDDGVLSVAKFHDDGSMTWLPLVYGQGPLTEINRFRSQADVLIETRRAADLVGATPMDRPEDFQPNPVTGTVFAVLTNNTARKADQIDAANPRADNRFGHIIELIPPGGRGSDADHAADTFGWEMFIQCGDPTKPDQNAHYPNAVTQDGWFVTPDNIAFDSKGRLWIATDGAEGSAGFADGIWACELEGPERGKTRHFFSVPIGAEMCGPTFTPDDSTLFLSVQHPGAGKRSSFEEPITRWPDFVQGMPPRPSVVVVTRDEGGPIA
jgi:secreted PhoX family phosphatase